MKPNDLLSHLKRRNESLFHDHSFLDRTDTVSIASMQSSIFDFDSSTASYKIENIGSELNNFSNNRSKYSFKVRPFKFHEKVPENWLYTNPKQKIIESKENPIEWMRTIFDENDTNPLNCKSNLTQTLSKSHSNLISNDNFEFDNKSPPLYLYKSVSDLKNIEISDKLKTNKEETDSQNLMTQSKTAPSSTENINEFRSSFQDFIALAKQQEEKLKAEVLKRRTDLNETRASYQPKQITSVRYIKNNRKSVPINRFGFPDFNPAPNPPKVVSTRYSKQVINQSKPETVSSFKPRLSMPTVDTPDKPSDKLRVKNLDNYRKSANYKTNIKLYHV